MNDSFKKEEVFTHSNYWGVPTASKFQINENK